MPFTSRIRRDPCLGPAPKPAQPIPNPAGGDRSARCMTLKGRATAVCLRSRKSPVRSGLRSQRAILLRRARCAAPGCPLARRNESPARHAYRIWAIADDPKLSPEAGMLIVYKEDVIAAASVLEIAIKHASTRGKPNDRNDSILQTIAIRSLPFEFACHRIRSWEFRARSHAMLRRDMLR